MQPAEQRHLFSALLQQGQEAHKNADYAAEEKAYLTILSLCEKHGVAMFLLGRLYLYQSRFQEAEPLLKFVVEQHPEQVEARFLLGNALLSQGHPEEAISHFHFLLRLDPKRVDVLNNLGVALQRVQNFEEAEAVLRRALSHREDATGWFNLGNLLREMHKEEAVTAFRRALQLNPDHVFALNNLGSLLHAKGLLEEAANVFAQVTLRKPDFLDAHLNLAHCLRESGKSREAVGVYRRVLALDPNHVAAHSFLGMELFALGQITGAISSYRKAIALEPDNFAARNNLAIALLLTEEYTEGWAEYEYRLDEKAGRSADTPAAIWKGEDAPGKSLLIQAEQGAGDTLQFVRYVSQVREKFRRVSLSCQPGLGFLLRESGIADTVNEMNADDPITSDDDLCVSLMSLPLLCGAGPPLPSSASYLHPQPEKEIAWFSRLIGLSGTKIGLCWAGSPTHYNDRNRSCPLSEWLTLRDIPGVSFVSLQTGPESKSPQASWLAFDVTEHLTDYAETAAAIENLDLVITVDTSVAHLAGALGKPVWTLLPFLPDWRWGLHGETTPWYASMRLFRQPRPGDWTSVLARVKSELEQWALPKAA